MCASAECLPDLVGGDNNLQDCVVVCKISWARAHNNWVLGWSIAAEWKGIPLSSAGYLSGPINVQCILLKFFHFLSEYCLLIMSVSASVN